MSKPTLRELLTQRIDALEKLTDERADAEKRALKLQAAEYKRRLKALNGEAARLRKMQETYLPRETYEADKRMILVLFVSVGVSLVTAIVGLLR